MSGIISAADRQSSAVSHTTPTSDDGEASLFSRTVNPATGETIADHGALSDAEFEAVLDAADTAFSSWRATPLAERVEMFEAIAKGFDARADEIAAMCSTEMGMPFPFAKAEVALVSSMFRYYAAHGPELLAEDSVDVPGLRSAVVRKTPVGVVLGIEPWNAPMYQAMRVAAPNLMLGNTVVVKPSAVTPASTLLLDEVLREAGVPAGVYTTALISHHQASVAIADPRVRAVTLTGSNRAGERVGELAGRHIKPVVLELGGSDAFIVLDSADVPAAAAIGATCRVALSGQICSSPKRVIVTDTVADEFIEKYVDAFSAQVVGDPFDPSTTVGPLSTVQAAKGLQAMYDDAVEKGATVLLAGGQTSASGAFFQPAVLTDLTPDMRLYNEEAFGPLGLIFRVPDADAAVKVANSSQFGLGGSVFGEETEALAVAEQLDTGMVGINTWMGAPIEIPFGGTKASGVGRELGRSGMDAFANVKTYGKA